MKGGYESMVWLNDKDGQEFVCYIEDLPPDIKHKENLTEEDLKKCMNVNDLIGTERW